MHRFNVRVYGLLIQNGKVLVSDEFIKGHRITKFPGGGLEFGEGTIDCLKREFIEELDLDVEIVDHFYTTDFFVESAFAPNNQVISIYYTVKAKYDTDVIGSDTAHDYDEKEGAQSFRWLSLNTITSDDLTLIIDKKVADMLSKHEF